MSIFDNFIGGKNSEEIKKQENAERLQRYLNKFHEISRDLDNTEAMRERDTKKDGLASYAWQAYSWIEEATATSNERSNRYREYKEMCKVPELNQGLHIYCLHPDTVISTLKGDYTIKELAEGKLGNEFEVWSYNTKENKVDIGKAKDPHITLRNTDVYKVTFDNGSEIIATDNHPFLLKTGEYKELGKLVPGDRIVPFYSREKQGRPVLSTMKYGSMGYHQYVYFLKTGKRIKKPNIIHHKDGNKYNNSFDNLVIMTNEEHTKLHMQEDTRIKKLIEITQQKRTQEKISKSWTNDRKKEFGQYIKNLYDESPEYRNRVARPGNLNGRWIDLDVDIYEESKKHATLNEMSQALNIDRQVLERRIMSLGFSGWTQLREHHCLNFMSNNLDKKFSILVNNSPYSRAYFYDMMKKIGYNSWSDMQHNYENHRVISIEYYGKSDVYDMEVEEFHNFNANGVFVHNSDNATQYNINNNVLEIQSDNQKIIEILEKLFFERLDINSNLWTYAKNMCKFGDEFLEVILDSEKAPKNIVSLERIRKPENMKRKEKKNKLEGFEYEYAKNEEKDPTKYEPWQIIHLSIEDDEFEPYGKSILEAGRKVWKRLSLMEDAMLVYRISRAPERRVFYIDVGTLSTKDANNYIEQLKRKFKKKSFVNPNTGEIDEKANPMSVDEDFFIAVRENSQGTRIETLPPGQNLGEIDDVKYFKDMIMKTLGIPNGYLGGATEGVAYDPKSYLSNQEIQFARTIERIQKFIIKGLEKAAIIELALKKFTSDDLKNFKIKLTPPSNVDQLMEVEIRNQQFTLIQSIRALVSQEGIPFLPDDWVYKNVLGFSEKEISTIKLQNQMQLQLNAQMQGMLQGMGAGSEAGGVGMTPAAGGLGGAAPEVAGGPEVGGEAPAGGEATPPAEPGLEVASKTIEFDGGKWLLENEKDAQKLLKYINLYEKVHKDNKDKNKIYEQNSVTRMTIKGEFTGLLKAYKRSITKSTLTESKNK
ncbi:MAG TPA: portal protein [Candidatus Paceibacterota bacterium]|nr:portal protein [Candidatus Paceibacterota bacterium]